MTFEFQRLSQNNALIIANRWKYDGAYSFYDMTADLEDYKVYRRCGFRDVKVIQQSSNGGIYEFLVMEKAR